MSRHGPLGFGKLCLFNLRLILTGKASQHQYVYDDAWDRKYGVQTSGSLEVDEITASVHEKIGAVRYEPTPPECFAYLLNAAVLEAGIAYTFIDVGSGKGRVLLMAALHGFERVIGIEFGEDLHQAACRNIALMEGHTGETHIASIRADARSYDFPPEPTLCFLNNPFDGEVLDRLLANIEASLTAYPRPFTIIYYHSNHADRLGDRHPWQLVKQGHWKDDSHHFCIYRAQTDFRPS